MEPEKLIKGNVVYCPHEGWAGEVIGVAEDHYGALWATVIAYTPMPSQHRYLQVNIEAYDHILKTRKELH